MIDYVERVEEVTGLLRHEYGVEDTQAVEILLASAIECEVPYPWIILETPYYRLDPAGAWFSRIIDPGFVRPLPLFRTPRPRHVNGEVLEILKERNVARLFVEPNWEIPTITAYQFRLWPYLLQECVRLRTPYPKSLLANARAGPLVEQAVDRALDSRFRSGTPQLAPAPRSLPYWCELLQRLAPPLRDWERLLTNLCAIAGRRAYLFNRPVDSTDWDAVSRVMRDSVPQWTGEIVGHFGRQGRLRSMRKKYSQKMILAEMKRLLSDGVLINHRGEWIIRDLEQRGGDFIALIRGENICCN